jgi:hypothetical protein
VAQAEVPKGTVEAVPAHVPLTLTEIASLSATDAWAVGMLAGQGDAAYSQHWDGAQWSVVDTPAVGGESALTGVVERAEDDVWAVGWKDVGQIRTLILHWDGGHWSVVPSPTPPEQGDCVLARVTAAADGSLWAAGTCDAVDGELLVERWNGQRWKISYLGGGEDTLEDVSASSATDAWVLYTSGSDSVVTSFLHWDGTHWHPVRARHPGRYRLRGISSVTADDSWAAGPIGLHHRGLAEHWDGHRWSTVELPSHPGRHIRDSLDDVSLDATDHGWAVGGWASPHRQGALLEQYDGVSWSLVRGPDHDRNGHSVSWTTVTSSAPDNAWMLGRVGSSSEAIAHWDGSAWRVDWPMKLP